MRMGYNTMNVMCLGINPLAPARIQGFRFAPPPACGLSPLRGLAMSLHIVCGVFIACPFTGVRCAPPPACGLPPLTGLNGWAFFIRLYVGFHRPFTGVSLRSTTCL